MLLRDLSPKEDLLTVSEHSREQMTNRFYCLINFIRYSRATNCNFKSISWRKYLFKILWKFQLFNVINAIKLLLNFYETV